MENEVKKQQCPEFPFFGAPYPDARCIDGRLWDLDNCEGHTLYSSGDNPPCPFCNLEEYIEYDSDDFDEDGNELTPDQNRDRITKWVEKMREKYY